MITHRQIIAEALAMHDDPSGFSLFSNEQLGVELMEIVQNLTILKSRSLVDYANVTIPGVSYVTGVDLVPVVNLHETLPRFFVLLNAGINSVATDRASIDTFLIFSDAWRQPGEITEHWLAGNNIFGVRRVPVFDSTMTLAYIPYVEISSLDDPIALRDEYAYALQMLVLAFILARVSRFDLAKLAFQRWLIDTEDASRRVVSMRTDVS